MEENGGEWSLTENRIMQYAAYNIQHAAEALGIVGMYSSILGTWGG